MTSASRSSIRKEYLNSWWLRTLLPPIALGILAAALLYPLSLPFVIRANRASSLRLSYSGSNSGSKSPVCGCMVASSHEWRGVTFLTRSLSLEVASKARTSLIVSGAFPNLIAPLGGFDMTAKELVMAIPAAASFDPDLVAPGISQTKTYRILETRSVESAMVGVLGAGYGDEYSTVNIKTYADVPIVAWIPARESSLEIPADITEHETYDVHEMYGASPFSSIGDEYKNHDINMYGSVDDYSILDILGPRVVIWRYDSKLEPKTKPSSNEKLVWALAIEVPFSLRVAVPRIVAEDNGKSDGFHARISRSPFDERSWKDVFSRLSNNPTTIAYGLTLNGPIGRGGEIIMRWPPIPNNNDINVFGEPFHILLNAAEGAVTIGAIATDVPGPSDVDIRDVSQATDDKKKPAVPITIAPGRILVNRDRTASGVVRVNGRPVSRLLDSKADLFAASGVAASILAGLGWLSMRLRDRLRKRNGG